MLIIGHRGATGVAPENTIQGFQAALDAKADMIEFDIRLTRDGVPVVIHDPLLLRTHKQRGAVHSLTLAELQEKTKSQPVPTLAEVLETFFGKIKLNVECKSKGSGAAALQIVERYIKQEKDWENILFASFHLSELKDIRRLSTQARLALLHTGNPFRFTAHINELSLYAVGFYKFTINPLAITIAKKRGLFVYVYTVNRSAVAKVIKSGGVDGLVTDHPELFTKKKL